MGGYTPGTIILKKSQPARIIFDRKDPSPCLDQIVFQTLECMQICLWETNMWLKSHLKKQVSMVSLVA